MDQRGYVDEHEYIFDLYTKFYDFQGTNVKVISAQDLWDFYEAKHNPVNKKDIDVYEMAEFFIEEHSNGHFVVDECPFKGRGKYNI